MLNTTLAVVAVALGAPDSDHDYRASLLADAMVRDDLSLATEDGRFSLDIGWFGQARFTSSFLQEPVDGDEDVVLGGSIRRNKLKLKGNAGSEDLSYNVVFATAGGGSRVVMEDVNLVWRFEDGLAARIGQGKQAYWLERSISSGKQLAADRSRVARVFDQGYSQFVEMSLTRDRWRLFGVVGDGLGSQNTDFTDEASDIALTLRAEHRIGEAPWKAFEDFISFPGADSGLMLGGVLHFETGGETFGTIDRDIFSAIADATYKGDGWNAHAAGIWRSTRDGMDYTDMGVLVQGGVFVDERNELFARWDTVFSDDDREGSDTFSTLTAGLNHYLFENSHSAVVTGDVQYLFDETTGELIGGTGSLGQMEDAESGQVVIRVQLEVSF